MDAHPLTTTLPGGAMPSPALAPPSTAPAGTPPGPLGRSTLLALCACVLVAQSMVAAINLLIPQLAASALHPSATELLWTVDAYVIVFAGLLIPAGALGDRRGRRASCSPDSSCSPPGPRSAPWPPRPRC
ncbi:hypothetical protein O1L60_35955 [Streptomyces diastatochromogenes]|nr:hypothetical protein [Streptomyces diastatochromogenes]